LQGPVHLRKHVQELQSSVYKHQGQDRLQDSCGRAAWTWMIFMCLPASRAQLRAARKRMVRILSSHTGVCKARIGICVMAPAAPGCCPKCWKDAGLARHSSRCGLNSPVVRGLAHTVCAVSQPTILYHRPTYPIPSDGTEVLVQIVEL
jgi:hypothetical protein